MTVSIVRTENRHHYETIDESLAPSGYSLLNFDVSVNVKISIQCEYLQANGGFMQLNGGQSKNTAGKRKEIRNQFKIESDSLRDEFFRNDSFVLSVFPK